MIALKPIDIDQAPMNTTVFWGRYATFRCSSVSINPGSSTILWFMNETLIHQLPHEYDASSVSSQRTDAINGENSTFTVLGSEQSNGTHYRCGVLDLVTTTIVNYSALVTLTVQGVCTIHVATYYHFDCCMLIMTIFLPS